MKKQFDAVAFLDDLESRWRKGDSKAVTPILKELKPDSVPRPLLARLAKICFRAGQPRIAIKLLNEVVRIHTPAKPHCSNEEIAVYALSQMEIGVYNEAVQLFSSMNPTEFPEADFYLALTYFKLWNYKDSIPVLERYVSSQKITDYQRLVGNVNLAAAFISERHLDKARTLLDQIRNEAEKNQHHLLSGNISELTSQLCIYEKEYDEARKYLQKAKKVLSDNNQLYALFVEKWLSITDLMEFGPRPEKLERLKAVREESLRLHHWSSVRECDLFLAVVTCDIQLFKKIYFGTPYAGYRSRMLRLFNISEKDLDKTYNWSPQGEPISKKLFLDVENGVSFKNGTKLKKGQLQHRLLKILCSDFYAPFKPEELFSLLFGADEKFNTETSVARIYNGIGALKSWLEESKLPLQIISEDNGYRLQVIRPCVLQVSRSCSQQAEKKVS